MEAGVEGLETQCQEADLEVAQLLFFMVLEQHQQQLQTEERETMEMVDLALVDLEVLEHQGHWCLYEIFFS